MSKTIAIVEDEPALRENYADALTRYGYRVKTYRNRREADTAFQQRLPDLVVIDIGLEDEPEGGFDLCRDLRARSATLPIIFLTARDSDFDTISGLRLGADDYLTKDISIAHLQARITTLFRRLEAIQTPARKEDIVKHGELEIDTDRLLVRWRGVAVPLTVTEFWLVHTIARYPGHVKNRDQLMDDAKIVVDDTTITSHIKRIRRKFAAIDPGFERIETIYGAGYRWRPD